MVNIIKNLRPFKNYNFKIQWEIHFLTFFNIDPNSSKKNRIEIWILSFQICFRNQFWTLGSGQTENTQIRVFLYFPFDHIPKSKIDSKNRFEMRMSIFLFKIFFTNSANSRMRNFFKEFRPIFKNVKKWISHCMLKL